MQEAGKGFITLRDVATMATVHDFTWSDEELQDMIRCFDFDKDGKVGCAKSQFISTFNAKPWGSFFNFLFWVSAKLG